MSAEDRRARAVMALTTTQRAILRGAGRLAIFKSADEQEAYRRDLIAQLERAEVGTEDAASSETRGPLRSEAPK